MFTTQKKSYQAERQTEKKSRKKRLLHSIIQENSSELSGQYYQ